MLIAQARRQGRTYAGDPRPEAGSFFRSDHFPFAKAGVPAISWRYGRNLVNGGSQRGNTLADEYTAKRYHQPDDEYDPSWIMTGIAQDASLLHAVGRNLANSRQWPNWSSDSQFRSVRDQSQGERGAAPPPPRTGTVPVPENPTGAGERG
jgi:Zn-dependent M28 family amino/carboxypeptidase